MTGTMPVLLYQFDAGSGCCLWAGNDAARAALDYAIDHQALPLSPETRRLLDYLIAWHDSSVDWDNPASPAPGWTEAMADRFNTTADAGLALTRAELAPAGFSVIDRRTQPRENRGVS